MLLINDPAEDPGISQCCPKPMCGGGGQGIFPRGVKWELKFWFPEANVVFQKGRTGWHPQQQGTMSPFCHAPVPAALRVPFSLDLCQPPPGLQLIVFMMRESISFNQQPGDVERHKLL